MNQYEYQNQNGNASAFEEYVNNLPEDKKEEPQKKGSGIRISEKVEKDLESFSSHSRPASLRSNTSVYKDRRIASTGARMVIIFGATAMIAAVLGVGVMMVARNSYNDDYYYEIDPDQWVEMDPYMEEPAYQWVGEDLTVPEFMLDGYYYQLPVEFSQFTQNSWHPRYNAVSELAPGQTAQVSMLNEYNSYEKITLIVSNPGEETIPLEEATVTGFLVEDSGTDFQLPGGITSYSSAWYIEDILREQGLSWKEEGHGYESVITVEMPNDSAYELVFESSNDSIYAISGSVSDVQPTE
ncbi:MAG: hypothetical protein IKD69_13975 [Solobacterium sp.]|nr:hypothetical protein [Solobacterium sp.]